MKALELDEKTKKMLKIKAKINFSPFIVYRGKKNEKEKETY